MARVMPGGHASAGWQWTTRQATTRTQLEEVLILTRKFAQIWLKIATTPAIVGRVLQTRP
jgi:hypothetical protein